MAPFDAAAVRRYYDRHTRAFVTLGQGAPAGAIHRAVWGPGTRTSDDAFHYVDDRIAGLIRRLPSTGAPLHIVDLGCGIGASLCYLAERLPIRGTGITLSGVQAQMARQRIAAAGLSEQVVCLDGDYTQLPAAVAEADLAFAIESFVHTPSPERLFSQCGTMVRPGGLLVICDDFRRPTTDAGAARAIDRFTRGWHVSALLRHDEIVALAHDAGFAHESTTDLTPFVEIGRLRDRVLRVWAAAVSWLAPGATRFDPVVGGSALQTCLARGWIGYDLVVFRRR